MSSREYIRQLEKDLPPGTSFRSPELGDKIQTTEPLKCKSLTHSPGDYLVVMLETEESVREARHLVAERTWCVQDKTKGKGS